MLSMLSFTAYATRVVEIMVHFLANAHGADEPMMLAPALFEMKIFISVEGSSFDTSDDNSSSRM